MKKYTSSTTRRILASIGICLFLSACASGPTQQKPEIVESAYRDLKAGVSNYNKSKYTLAGSYFSTALSTFRSIDHREGIASSCLNLAKVHLEKNNLKQAAEYLDIAETLVEQSDIRSLRDHLSVTRSSLDIANNNLEDARASLDPIVRTEKRSAVKLAALQNRIRIAFIENDIDTARSLTNTLSASLSGDKNSTYQARLKRFEAKLSANREDAERNYQAALGIYRNHAHRPGIASTLHEWGDALIRYNEPVSAEDKLLRGLFVRQSMEDQEGSIRLLLSLNELYREQGQTNSSNRTIRWINKLSIDNFGQWKKFTRAFNRYPE